ncbi:MAG TPA: EamA family transporter, partial [Candidatus Limnocylindrales bacterium]|nr:EamA family transporter [Candidatus Limnocylindrales bacterium]
QPGSVTLTSVLGVAYLVVFGSMVAFSTYAWLLRSAPLSLVGTYAFINPVVAIFLGAVFLSESIGPRELLASAVIVVAVAMIVFGRSRASRLEAAEGAEGLDEALIDARRAEEAA